MYWRITHYTAGDVPSREYTVRARSCEAEARPRPERSRLDRSIARKE